MRNSENKPGGGRRTSIQVSLREWIAKPRETDFTQQRLDVWYPVLTVIRVIPVLVCLSVFFASAGLGIYVTSDSVVEFELDYTGSHSSSPCFSCAKNYSRASPTLCTCSVNFTLKQPFEGDVFMYYGLTNFYQNHRHYVKSRDDNQLNGDLWALKNPSAKCRPHDRDAGLPVAPCGAISNSVFNDTLKIFRVDGDQNKTPVPLVKKDIAWWSDKHQKFRNPKGNSSLSGLFEGTSKPVNWRKPVYELDPSDANNNGLLNEDLMVWMRPATLPRFRKLYRIIRKKSKGPTLAAGTYVLDVTYNFPVTSFGGSKRMVLSTMSWMGGKNPFLGLAYIAMGAVLFLLSLFFVLMHFLCTFSCSCLCETFVCCERETPLTERDLQGN